MSSANSRAQIAYLQGLYANTKLALALAVNMVMQCEPGDSRAVSNEAVALAAVSCGDTSEPVMQVIRQALKYEEGRNYGTAHQI